MRDRFPLVVVGGLALLGAIVWFLVQGGRRGGFADELSTFRSAPGGARALYVLLEEAQLPVARYTRDLQIVPTDKNLVLLGTGFEDQQSLALAAAFDGSDGGVDDDQGVGDPPARSRRSAFGVPSITSDENTKLLEAVRSGATVVFVPSGAAATPLTDALDVQLERAASSLSARTLIPAQPSRFVKGVERVVTRVETFLQLPAGAVPLLIDDTLEKPVAALVPYGQGRVIIIGAPHLATNEALTVADNARFWFALFSAVSASRPLAFDEFHHGFRGERSMGEFASRSGLFFAVGQLLLGVALWALALRRFGRPKVPVSETRVGGTDALLATARLYREGRHAQHAAGCIARGISAELATLAGVSTTLEPAHVGAALELRGRKALARALLEITRAANAATSDADVERVATLAALARKNLHPQQRTATT